MFPQFQGLGRPQGMWMVLFLMQNGGNMKVSHHPGGDGCNPGRGNTSQGVCIYIVFTYMDA